MIFPWPFSKRQMRYSSEIVDLILDKTIVASAKNDYVPSMIFHIVIHDTNIRVGTCDLRVGMNEELYYLGNIGYHVFEKYRGNHYAYYATLILFQIAKEEWNMDTLIITCSEDNLPSKRILRKLNGIYLETANVPQNHWLYRQGQKTKEIYQYHL